MVSQGNLAGLQIDVVTDMAGILGGEGALEGQRVRTLAPLKSTGPCRFQWPVQLLFGCFEVEPVILVTACQCLGALPIAEEIGLVRDPEDLVVAIAESP
ncbi:hypothetical protein D3C86_1226550 [compost metagenome]